VAKIKAFTDASGVEHPDAVWFPNQVHICHSDRTVHIVFEAWHDLASLAARRSPVPGATQPYVATEMTYLMLVGSSPSDQPTVLDVVAQPIYDYVATVLDTPSENDPEVMVSFFDGCSDVTI